MCCQPRTSNAGAPDEEQMMIIPSDKLAYIIAKAREFDAEVAPVDERSGSNPSDDAELDVLEATRDNPTYEELVAAIDELNEDEQTELVALVWLGRGDYTGEDWEEALKEARRERTTPTSAYLTGTPLLADYLEEGLTELGMSATDLGSA
jgi:hypothetical protein